MTAARLSAKQAKALGLQGAARSKYRNKRTVVDGIPFASAREAKRWGELTWLEAAGKIRDLERQVPFELRVKGVLICRYRADFVYVENGERVVEDTKGFNTREYKMKRSLMLACHGITIRET